MRAASQTLQKEESYAKYSKYDLWIETVSSLGPVISKYGISANLAKIVALIGWEHLKFLEVRRILPPIYGGIL